MSLSGVQTRIRLDPRVVREPERGRGDRVVRLELDHRPEDDAQRLDGGLGDRELGQQLGRHPGRRLVAREEVVAERLDDAVGRAARRASRPPLGAGTAAGRRGPRRPRARRRRARGPAAAARNAPGRARRSRRRGGARTLRGQRIRVCQHRDARGAHRLERSIAVARLQVDRGDRVGQHARSRSRGARHRGPSP